MSATETNQVTTAEAPVSRISELSKHDGQIVTIRGWLYNLRESGKLLFPHLPRRQRRHPGRGRQGSRSRRKCSRRIKGLTQESSVIVTGTVRADKRAPGGYELDVSDVQGRAEGARRRSLSRSRRRSTASIS